MSIKKSKIDAAFNWDLERNKKLFAVKNFGLGCVVTFFEQKIPKHDRKSHDDMEMIQWLHCRSDD